MLRLSWRAVLFLTIFLSAVMGNWSDTSTGIDLDKLRQFPLFKIHSGWLKQGSRMTFDGITASASAGPREVCLRGAGKSGKQWEAHLSGLDEVWRGDLDGNGTQDYVFFGPGPLFNGRITPLYSLSILLMDADGMPVPFFTVIYHGENGDGIKHLVDLNHDGHAELLISSYDEHVSDPRLSAFCSGHWVNQLYRFKDLAAEEIRGSIGGITFPLIHDWTYWGTQCTGYEGPPSPIEPAVLHDHGTSTQGQAPTAILTTGVAADPSAIGIDPVAGCKTVSPKMIVFDRARRREIGFLNLYTTYSTDLADRIRRAKARVELRGIDKQPTDGECSVNLMWAH